MSPTEIIPIACSLISCGCAVFVAVRANNWRQSDAAQELNGRIGSIESRVQACEIRLQDLPSRADIAELRGEIHRNAEVSRAAAEGVRRIETFLMQNKVSL